MKERIKEIRKSTELSQEAFGKRLGVSGAAISRLEQGERGITEQMVLSISREFNVSEEWLRNGSGDMFVLTQEDELQELQIKYHLDNLDLKILREYLKLSSEHRKIFKNYFVNVFGGVIASEDEKIDLEVEAYREELEAERRFTTSEVSPDTGAENEKTG
jgi:transcriptional regulator with XRE-family HTH domain